MTKKQKKDLLRIGLTGLILVLVSLSDFQGLVRFSLYLFAYLLVGHDVLYEALMGIKNRQPFDESLLMSIATLGALALGLAKTGDYLEAVSVMLFYQIGEWFQSYAVGKSRKNIGDLMDIAPDFANIEGADGKLRRLDPDEVEVGSIIVVKPGEKIPLDGHVVEGASSLNTAALTGESLPRDVGPGDHVVSGSINMGGLLRIETEKAFEDSTASRIIELIEEASSRKSKSENFITRFSRVYTPAVVFGALALALVPPLVRLAMGTAPLWSQWVYRSLTFLIISCPCALVLSVPLSFFSGIGGASRYGVLIKGSNYLETLARVDRLVYDKTGTLTKGNFSISHVEALGISKEDLVRLGAQAEKYSDHPIAQSLREAYGEDLDRDRVEEVEEIPGQGISALVEGARVYVGNSKLMDGLGLAWTKPREVGSYVHLAKEGAYLGYIVISDQVKDQAKEALGILRMMGIRQQVMLTGDSDQVAQAVGASLGLDQVYSQLLPQDKVAILEDLLDKKDDPRASLAYVGDGINDAPVLSRADIGIAMGAMGSDAAIEAADIVLMDDNPLKLATAIRIAKKTMAIVRQNTFFAIGVKFLVLGLSALGLANLWAAVFADVGVAVLAVLNAMRSMYIREVKMG